MHIIRIHVARTNKKKQLQNVSLQNETMIFPYTYVRIYMPDLG